MSIISSIRKKRQEDYDAEYPLGKAIDAIEPQQIRPATAQQQADMYPTMPALQQQAQPAGVPPLVAAMQSPAMQQRPAQPTWTPTMAGPGDPWAAGSPQQQPLSAQPIADPWAPKQQGLPHPAWWYEPGF